MRFYDMLWGDNELIASKDEHVPVIVADNIARQLDLTDLPPGESDELDTYTWPAESYGTVTPPFPISWIESITETVYDGVDCTLYRGVIYTDMTFARDGFLTLLSDMREIIESARWIVTADSFSRAQAERGLEVPIYFGTSLLFLDDDGRLMTPMERVVVLTGMHRFPHIVSASEGAATHLPFALLAISAMHKRVPVEHVEPEPPPRHVRRRRERETGRKWEPEHDYYVLMVKPSKPGSFEEIGGDPIHVHRRRHVVRGHFRWYGEKGLFGRTDLVNRMVWVPAHERGEEEHGLVTKDYRV